METISIKNQITPNFSKSTDQLIPAIVQDEQTKEILMLGYMNEEAYLQTMESKKVTFYSRSRKQLWVKGETSGNYLTLKSISIDCDNDTLLVKALPCGPTCHTGNYSCFNSTSSEPFSLAYLEKIIEQRKQDSPERSYTARLFGKGINKIAQKVGEEAVEMVIEAKDQNNELFINEAADLMFHYLLLLNVKGFQLSDVVNVLELRHLGK